VVRGMLTNWQTIQLSIKKLKYLETSLTHGLLEKYLKRRCAFIETISKLDKYLGGMKIWIVFRIL
jgi:ribosomal protein S2